MNDKRILVVDDEPQIRELFSYALTRAGFFVTCAGSAEDALEILKYEKYWVMFLDLNLPGMNGLELCQKVRQAYPMVVAFAVTGYASIYELSDCRAAGFEDYFTKPAKIADILAVAENAFKKIERWKRK